MEYTDAADSAFYLPFLPLQYDMINCLHSTFFVYFSNYARGKFSQCCHGCNKR